MKYLKTYELNKSALSAPKTFMDYKEGREILDKIDTFIREKIDNYFKNKTLNYDLSFDRSRSEFGGAFFTLRFSSTTKLKVAGLSIIRDNILKEIGFDIYIDVWDDTAGKLIDFHIFTNGVMQIMDQIFWEKDPSSYPTDAEFINKYVPEKIREKYSHLRGEYGFFDQERKNK